MFYREVLRRVGKVRSEILIINLYRSWEWRALLRVEKVEKKLIGKKGSVKKWVPWYVRGGSLRDSVILVLFHTGKLESHKVPSDNGVMGSKPKTWSYWGETTTPQCHSSLHRASSYGSISLVYSNREGSQKCYFVKNAPLIQCWKNYINTPTENLNILNPFWSSLCMLLPIFNSLHMQIFLVCDVFFTPQLSFC